MIDIDKGLRNIVENVEGALGITLIGLDGLPIAQYSVEGSPNISILGAELTMLYKNAMKASDGMEFGSLQEVSIVTDTVVVICRAVTEEYFLLLASTPEALFGKGRYKLKASVEKFKEILL